MGRKYLAPGMKFLPAVILLGLAFSWGRGSVHVPDPPPDPEPVIVTKTETVTVQVPVPQPFPTECRQAMKYTQQVSRAAHSLDGLAVPLVDLAGNFVVASATKDINEIVNIQDSTNRLISKTSGTSANLVDALNSYDQYIDQCLTALDKGETE